MIKKEFFSACQSFITKHEGFLYFAPGRVNLLGDHTDYTGGHVLPIGIQYGTWLFIRLTGNDKITLSTKNLNQTVTIDKDNYNKPTKSWADYPLGILNELIAKGLQFTGIEMVFYGDLPIGAGLASSASMEMVTAFALNDLFSMRIDKPNLSKIAQHAEQEFVGVSCGIMDQYCIAFSQENHALLIDCHSLEHQAIPIESKEYSLLIIDSKVKHKLSGSIYNKRVNELKKVKQLINGYFEIPYLGSLKGEDYDWLDKLIESDLLKQRLRHVVNENTRVELAAECLKNHDFKSFGKLMFDSHESLALDFGVSCKELDVLVDTAARTDGVAGARMTGAGFGGCTINLVEKGAEEDIKKIILADYKQKTGNEGVAYNIRLEGTLHKVEA